MQPGPRLVGISDLQAANRFLQEHYIAAFNRQFAHRAAQEGTAFVPLAGQDLDCSFSLQHECVVNRDDTVSFANLNLQMEPVRWRNTLAGRRVTV